MGAASLDFQRRTWCFIDMCNLNSPLVESISRTNNRPESPLRITHVVLALDTGGLERIVVDLIRVGLAQGHQPSVICLERRGNLASQIENIGIPVLCANKQPGLRFRTIHRVRELLSELKPHVLHSHQIGALLYAGPAARREKVPVVVHTEHINNIAKYPALSKRIRTRLLWGLAGSFADRFCCVSDDIASAVKAYRTVPSRKVSVVLNGIDTAAFDSHGDGQSLRRSLGIPHDVPVIGTVGRLNEVKRQDLLIQSFANIAKCDPKPHLLLVGDGPESESLRGMAIALGLADRIHFAGYQSRPEDFLQVMDIFAITSRLEGTPLVVLEAWAAGRPVIASRVGGIPTMINQGQNGLLFDCGDEAELTEAISRLLASSDDARRLGVAGREFVRARFDRQVMASTYNRHYRELLGDSARKRLVRRSH